MKLCIVGSYQTLIPEGSSTYAIASYNIKFQIVLTFNPKIWIFSSIKFANYSQYSGVESPISRVSTTTAKSSPLPFMSLTSTSPFLFDDLKKVGKEHTKVKYFSQISKSFIFDASNYNKFCSNLQKKTNTQVLLV